jgi:hypothetical protein
MGKATRSYGHLYLGCVCVSLGLSKTSNDFLFMVAMQGIPRSPAAPRSFDLNAHEWV